MGKMITLALFLAFLIGGVAYWGLSEKPDTEEAVLGEDSSVATYFYGAECPHCKDVSNFLEENNIAEKVNFVKKEVWHDKKNAKEMKLRAESCNIQPDGMGVPFVYANGECFVGTPSVIGFFKKSAGGEESQ